MAEERLPYWDLFLALLFLAVGIVGLMLYNMPQVWLRLPGSATLTDVGTVFSQQGQVRYRSQALPFWHDLAVTERQIVHNGGAIFTGDGSAAVLALNQGIELSLNENSLIVVQVNPQTASPLLNVSQGSVKVLLAKPSASVPVKVGSKVFNVRAAQAGGEVKIDVREGNLKIINSGAAPVKVDGRDLGNGAVISEDAVAPVLTAVDIEKLDIVVAAPTPAASPSPELIAEASPSPEPSVVPEPPREQIVMNLPQVNVPNTVVDGVSRRSLRPRLAWDVVQGSEKYKIEVKDARGETIVSKTIKRPRTQFEIREFPQSDLTYNVTAFAPNGDKLGAGSGVIQIRSVPPAPREIHQKGINVLLTWEHTAMSDKYEYEISNSPQFKQIQFKGMTSENFALQRLSLPGFYFMRVRSVNAGQASAWSTVKEFEFRDPDLKDSPQSQQSE